MQGWGTSLAWFANVLGSSEALLAAAPQRTETREHVADLLFESKHLGMSICRYNIGSAGWDSPDKLNLRPGANVDRCARL